MKRPQNFNKLEGHYISNPTERLEFRFEVGRKDENEIWVFDDTTKYMGDYCTLVTMDWPTNKYYMRKCLRNQGYDGENIPGTFSIDVSKCKTPDSFADALKEQIVYLSKLQIYSN